MQDTIQRLAKGSFAEPLWQVQEPPEELFVRGLPGALDLLHRLPERGLAIVGTRTPQARSIALLRDFIPRLANAGMIILSGMAFGIDAEAHRLAVQSGIPTVAVLAGGADRPFPRGNETLAEQIVASGGLLISEFPLGSIPYPGNFLQRNRLIAGWAKATWVVEAGARSGALNTARWARDMHRACFATPCFPGDQSLAGNQRIIDHDHAHPVWGPHSLGCAWLDFAAEPAFDFNPKSASRASGSDEDLLQNHVRRLTAERGGAQVQDVLEWSIDRGWNAARFFTTLQKSLETGRVTDTRGILVSRRSTSRK